MGQISLLIGRSIRPTNPPLLVMSLPRSGSSWIGNLIGQAPNALFLREPINQSHLATGGDTTVFDVDPCAPPDGYALFAARAFAGIPIFPPGVVRNAAQWKLPSRAGKRVVIKEVNPLALDWLLKEYQPRVIFLVRHPAAVASSYWNLNWRNAEEKLAQFGPRLMSDLLRPWHREIASASGFWQAQGIFQGAVLHAANQALAGYKDYQVITYESLCGTTESTLAELFQFAGLTFDASVKQLISYSSNSDGQDEGNAYSTRRNTSAMATAWKRKVSPEQLASLRNGYSAFKLPFYNNEDDWKLEF